MNSIWWGQIPPDGGKLTWAKSNLYNTSFTLSTHHAISEFRIRNMHTKERQTIVVPLLKGHLSYQARFLMHWDGKIVPLKRYHLSRWSYVRRIWWIYHGQLDNIAVYFIHHVPHVPTFTRHNLTWGLHNDTGDNPVWNNFRDVHWNMILTVIVFLRPFWKSVWISNIHQW